MFLVSVRGLCGPLLHKDQVPEHFHESYIVKGYRHPKSSPLQCVLSLFDATNETLNFWTHFLPSWYFMWILRDTALTLDFRHDSYTWPLLGYLVMCCIYPLASSVAHLFNTMSDSARHICFFLDYSAIAAVAFSVVLAYKAYCFPTSLRFTLFGDIYLAVGFVNAILCVTFSCWTRLMPASIYRKVLRLGALGLPCIYSVLPVAYRLLLGTEQERRLASNFSHFMSFVLLMLSAFLYGSHFPERMFPGSFDIVGHSHQLFHVCTILGSVCQMQGLLQDMTGRRAELLPDWEFPTASTSIGLLFLVLLINTAIIAIYSGLLYKKKLKAA